MIHLNKYSKIWHLFVRILRRLCSTLFFLKTWNGFPEMFVKRLPTTTKQETISKIKEVQNKDTTKCISLRRWRWYNMEYNRDARIYASSPREMTLEVFSILSFLINYCMNEHRTDWWWPGVNHMQMEVEWGFVSHLSVSTPRHQTQNISRGCQQNHVSFSSFKDF